MRYRHRFRRQADAIVARAKEPGEGKAASNSASGCRERPTNTPAAGLVSVDGRAGVPFLCDAVSGKPGSYRSPGILRPLAQLPPRPADAPPMRDELPPAMAGDLAA
jgi:hypothetical protein